MFLVDCSSLSHHFVLYPFHPWCLSLCPGFATFVFLLSLHPWLLYLSCYLPIGILTVLPIISHFPVHSPHRWFLSSKYFFDLSISLTDTTLEQAIISCLYSRLITLFSHSPILSAFIPVQFSRIHTVPGTWRSSFFYLSKLKERMVTSFPCSHSKYSKHLLLKSLILGSDS